MSNHQKYDLRAIGEFVLHPRNPRQGDLGAIAESIERNGWYGAVITQKSSGYVIAGNHRVMAARQLGFTSLPTFELDVDDATAMRIMLADNRSSDRASNDEGILAQLLQEIAAEQGDLAGTLYDSDDLDQLLRDIAGPVPAGADDVPDPPAEPITKPGEVIELGAHRLVCGDAFDPEIRVRLLGVESPDAIVTDPPYGIDLDTDYTRASTRMVGNLYRQVEGDSAPFDAAPLREAFERVREQFWFGANYYRRSLGGDDRDGSWIVWDKRIESMDSMLGSGFELIWSATPHQNTLLRQLWTGYTARNLDNPRSHPTEKPVRLLADIMDRWVVAGGLVLDPFGGSGSTLIACEQTGRRCVMIEIDPAYCDVIRARYAQFVASSHPTPA